METFLALILEVTVLCSGLFLYWVCISKEYSFLFISNREKQIYSGSGQQQKKQKEKRQSEL